MTATPGVQSKAIGAAYDRHIRGEPIEGSLVATIAYFVTLVLVRAYTTIAHPIPGGG